MAEEKRRRFATGPAMKSPLPALAVLAGCIAVALSQAWVALERWREVGIEGGEAAARLFFAAVFAAAAFGIVVALLERRNGRVLLDDTGITVKSWRGRTLTVLWEDAQSIEMVLPTGDDPELPFHWISLVDNSGSRRRLAGGPWSENLQMREARRLIVRRLGLSTGSAQDFRLAKLFPATRRRWS